MAQIFKYIFKSARPRQWLKNLALFTSLVFSGQLLNLKNFLTILTASIFFTILTSSLYIFNDILDIKSDKKHPLKKNRPIASGQLPIPLALFICLTGFFVSLFLMAQLSLFFFGVGLAYLIIQIAYTIWLKNQPILEKDISNKDWAYETGVKFSFLNMVIFC